MAPSSSARSSATTKVEGTGATPSPAVLRPARPKTGEASQQVSKRSCTRRASSRVLAAAVARTQRNPLDRRLASVAVSAARGWSPMLASSASIVAMSGGDRSAWKPSSSSPGTPVYVRR